MPERALIRRGVSNLPNLDIGVGELFEFQHLPYRLKELIKAQRFRER